MNAKSEDYCIETDFEESEDVYQNKSQDLDWQECAQKFLRNKNFMKDLEKEQEFLRQQLIFLAKDKNCMGCGIFLEKSEVKGQVDYSIVPELLGVDLELYRKQKQIRWRITEI